VSSARDYVAVSLVVCGGLWALQRGLDVDTTRRNREVFTEMVYSSAGESLTVSAVLPGGTTQQPLVDGVVVRGVAGPVYGDGPQEAERAGRELASPIAADDAAAAERGRRLYATYCSVCHDEAGEGRGTAVLRGLPPPPSLHAARARALPDGQVFHLIGHGQGAMAGYASQLDELERWQVVRHVRALQERSRP